MPSLRKFIRPTDWESVPWQMLHSWLFGALGCLRPSVHPFPPQEPHPRRILEPRKPKVRSRVRRFSARAAEEPAVEPKYFSKPVWFLGVAMLWGPLRA